MIKRSYIILTILISVFNCLNGFTQTTYTAVVADSTTREGVPFATLKVKHRPDGAYTNEKGGFKITLHEKDSIIISSIGYNTREFTFTNTDTLWLTSSATVLDQVLIVSERKLIACGIRSKKVSLSVGAKFGSEYVIKILLPDTIQNFVLNKVRLLTNRKIKDEILQLRVYSVNDRGLPGEHLLKRAVTLTRSMIRENTIDIADQTIICQKHIFIGIAWVGMANEKIDSSFLLRSTDEVPKALTYERTILDPEYRWRLISPNILPRSKSGNPHNIIVSAEVLSLQ